MGPAASAAAPQGPTGRSAGSSASQDGGLTDGLRPHAGASPSHSPVLPLTVDPEWDDGQPGAGRQREAHGRSTAPSPQLPPAPRTPIVEMRPSPRSLREGRA